MQIGSREWSDLIIDGARSIGIELTYGHTEKFAVHARELILWNKTFNLTAITDPGEVALKHFLDSLPAVHHIRPDATLLDIGSGGGFPGLPLKILMPSLSVTLIDASRKKVSFLKHVIRALKLSNAVARHIRAEDLAAESKSVSRFDVVISRAFSSLDHFFELALPLLAENGTMMALKGAVDQDDIRDMQGRRSGEGGDNLEPGFQFSVTVETFPLPFLKSNRSIIIFRKTKSGLSFT
ncbi:MAG: 16S rRNA (guanine(527)-N(7))-methyltransferase RsmG [Desulfobacterales bacterium]